jgi:hypothetical protein
MYVNLKVNKIINSARIRSEPHPVLGPHITTHILYSVETVLSCILSCFPIHGNGLHNSSSHCVCALCCVVMTKQNRVHCYVRSRHIVLQI